MSRFAVILDVDGTLCDIRSITGGDHGGHDGYHRAAVHCPANEAVVSAAQRLHESGYALLVVTARPERHRALTEQWLAENLPVPYESLYMRGAGSYPGPAELKADLLMTIRRDGFTVVHAFDDDPDVLRMWLANRIMVTAVQGAGGRSG